jgi:hypothetical protein
MRLLSDLKHLLRCTGWENEGRTNRPRAGSGSGESRPHEPLEPEKAAGVYPAISDVREALGRLVDALERRTK